MSIQSSCVLLVIIITLCIFFISSSSASKTIAQEHDDNDEKRINEGKNLMQPDSWHRWSIDWIKTFSAATEEISETTSDMIAAPAQQHHHQDNFPSTSSFALLLDPVRSLAAAATNLVGGGAVSVAQLRTSMPEDERRQKMKLEQDRSRQQQNGMYSHSVEQGEMMMLEDDAEDQEDPNMYSFSSGKSSANKNRNLFRPSVVSSLKNNKKSFSETVKKQQKKIHDKLFNNNNRNNNQKKGIIEGVVSGRALKTEAEMEQERRGGQNGRFVKIDDSHLHQLEREHHNNNYVDTDRNQRVAAAQVFTPQSLDLVLAQYSYAIFCSIGAVAVPFTPSMNFTCFNPTTLATASNFTVNGSTYISASFTFRQRLACYPEASYISKYCVCPRDRVLVRNDADGAYSCVALNYDCNLTVSSPPSFQASRSANLRNSLLDGVPLRLPYVDTVDRDSTAGYQMSATMKCAPIPYVDSNSNDGFTYVPASTASPKNSNLVTVYFGTSLSSSLVRITNRTDQAIVQGTYDSLQTSLFVYISNITTDPTKQQNISSSSSGNTNNVGFDITPINYLYDRGLFFLRPHSFMDFSDISGASVIRVQDLAQLPPAQAFGVMLGLTNISLQFVPSVLPSHFYTGGQLTVEFGFMLPATSFSSPLMRNVSYLAATSGFNKYTPMAQLVTFDVSNAPPPLPPAPAAKLATSTIALIAVAGVAALGAIVAIIVGVYRYRIGLAKKRTRIENKRITREEEKKQKSRAKE